jgi:beta-N-acetylhexosaminidase
MYLRRRVLALLALGAGLAAAAGAVTAPGSARRAAAPAPAPRAVGAPRAVRRAPAAPAAAAPATPAPALSVSELAGERIIDTYSGLTPPASLLRAIRAGQVAGVLLFGDNVSSIAQIHGVIARLQAAAAAGPFHAPLLILTDQEGGQVRRLPGAPALSEKAVGEQPNPVGAAAHAGHGAAHTLRAAGVNVNLAPVLDVFRTPGNFIDEFGRSYSSSAAVVARLGQAFIATQQRDGVAATAKHFPGLGAAPAGANTDERPVTLGLSLRALRTVDEAPYRSAVSAGVRLVMLSWAVYPALDAARPAGLSARVIGGELRGRLHFRGVTISDALGAGALSAYGSLGARGVLAAGAGVDLLLCTAITGSNQPADGTAVFRALHAAIGSGRLSRSAAARSAARVLALRSALG